MTNVNVARRRAVAGLGCLLAGAGAGARAQVAAGNLTLVVPFPPGGIVDAMVRQIGEAIAPQLGQTVLADNRPGAATLLGTQYVGRAAPDGRTLLVTTTAHLINALANPKAGYDPLNDFVPVVHLINSPALWVAGAAAPGKDARELLQHFATRSGELSVGTWGVASSTDIYAAMIEDATKVQLTRIPYKGEAPALNDTLAGVVATSFVTIGAYRAQAATGKLKPLAVTGPRRSPVLPDVPTFAEIGVPGPVVKGFVGILAPKGTPSPVVQRVAQAVQAVLGRTETARRYESQWGFEVVAAGAEALSATMRADLPRWERAIKSFNIRQE